jgi:small subunit ribosomal protein S16
MNPLRSPDTSFFVNPRPVEFLQPNTTGEHAHKPTAGGNRHCSKSGWQDRIVRFRRSVFVLTIRLARIGKKKKPFYRVVVIESSKPRNGRVVELVGTYDPLKKPAEIKLNAERVKYWLGTGAQPSDTVRSFIRLQKIA